MSCFLDDLQCDAVAIKPQFLMLTLKSRVLTLDTKPQGFDIPISIFMKDSYERWLLVSAVTSYLF